GSGGEHDAGGGADGDAAGGVGDVDVRQFHGDAARIADDAAGARADDDADERGFDAFAGRVDRFEPVDDAGQGTERDGAEQSDVDEDHGADVDADAGAVDDAAE